MSDMVAVMEKQKIAISNMVQETEQELSKSKVLSVRIEENLLKLIEAQAKEWNQSISQTSRNILSFYFLAQLYEEEWKQIHSENFENVLKELKRAGKKVELQRYRDFLSEVSSYTQLFQANSKAMKNSSDFMTAELAKLENAMTKLEKVEIVWKMKE